MQIWLDGWHALGNYAWTLTGILSMLLWGQIIIRRVLTWMVQERFTDAEYLSLSAAGWVVPLAVWAVLLFVCVFLFGEIAGRILSLLSLVITFFIGFKWGVRITLPVFLLMLLFAIFLVLNFAFLQKAVLPSYFDSAEHYRIIKNISGSISSSFAGSEKYYHAGFHVLSAAFVNFLQLSIVDVMLVFGQVLLASLPLPLFFIVRQETRSNAAALFAVLLAGVGWHMPAHLMNWGKYPALLSLVCIHFVFGLIYLTYRKMKTGRGIYVLLGSAVLFSALIHTRSVIVIACMFAALFILNLQKRLQPISRYIGIGLVLIVLMAEVGFIWQSDVLKPLLDGYIENDIWMVALAAFLLLFAIPAYSELTFFLLVWLSLLLLGLFIPINLPGYGMLTLLDRPYIQMLIYLPLTIIGGLGLVSWTQWLTRLFPTRSLPARLVVFLTLGLVIFNASFNHRFYPSDCCQFASRDDLAAFSWMDENLPPDAVIMIPSNNLYVTSFESSDTRAGVDGGIWITPLISRATVQAWAGLIFDLPEDHSRLCGLSPEIFVYAGGMPQSFNAGQLNGLPGLYQVVFSLPKTNVYRVVGCD